MANTVLDQVEHVIAQLTPVVAGAAKTTWSAMVHMRRFESIANLITCVFGVLVWGSIMVAILYGGYRFIKWIMDITVDNEVDAFGYKALSGFVAAITLALCCSWPGPNLSFNLQGLGSEQTWMGAIAPELSIVHDVYQKVMGTQGQ